MDKRKLISKAILNLKNRNLRDNQIKDELFNLEIFKKVKVIFSYSSLMDEVSTININKEILKMGKILALPVCLNNSMKFYQVKDLDSLRKGKYNILEPRREREQIANINDIILVPGRFFDPFNNRIGRGKGYYDKFLAKNNLFKIALSYNIQIIDKIDAKNHDQKMDLILKDLII